MKILILRFSSIGDIVLTTPVLRCIKTQFPEYKLHYATKKKFEKLLISNPYIDKIHYLDKELNTLIDELQSEKFDLIIDLHNNLRTQIIWAKLWVKRIAFDKINFEKWLYVNLKIDFLPYLHIVDRYMTTVANIGVKNDGKGLDFFIDNNENISTFNLPEHYAVYVIGGQYNTKKLPLNKQIELLNSISNTVILIGGKEDTENGELLAKKCKNVINLCGQLSINQSAMVMEKSNHIYSHDTGMMHIAAALQKPITSIWGNTTPRFGMYPYYGSSLLNETKPFVMLNEVKHLPCRPCSKIGFNKCPKGHFKCMEMQVFE